MKIDVFDSVAEDEARENRRRFRGNRVCPAGWILYLGAAVAADAPCSPEYHKEEDVPVIHLSLTRPATGRKYKATNGEPSVFLVQAD